MQQQSRRTAEERGWNVIYVKVMVKRKRGDDTAEWVGVHDEK